MNVVRKGQNFACGGCRQKLEEEDIYYVSDGIGYCIECANQEQSEVFPIVFSSEEIDTIHEMAKRYRMDDIMHALQDIAAKNPQYVKFEKEET